MPDWHEQVMEASDATVSRIAHAVASRAKQLCPVETGRLRESIHVEEKTPGVADVVVGTDYWIYNEYGHRQFAWGHDTGHESPAQPFMRPALYSARGVGMTIAPPFLPHAELVMHAWLLGIDGVERVGAELPTDQASWSEDGFVTYMGLGGLPRMQSPSRIPIFQIDCWAVNVNGGKAPWGKANQLAEIIRGATEAPGNAAWGIRPVTLPSNYLAARVVEASALTEPRRLFDDQGSVARYTFDMRLAYVAVAS